jgi:hypothetical protein
MITLANVLLILERYGIEPGEVALPRHIFAIIIREVQRIVSEGEQEDEETEDYEQYLKS